MTGTSPEIAHWRVVWLATSAFTLLFAVWLMFGMLAVKFKPEFGLSDSQLYTLTLVAILSGSLLRFHFGVWADRYGGRRVMLVLLLLPVLPTLAVSFATEYWHLLLCAAGFGISGNSFSAGVAWCAAWVPPHRQGLALGLFGAGNVGASITKLIGPAIIALAPLGGWGVIPGGWRIVPVIYAALLLIMAAFVAWLAPQPDRRPGRSQSFAEMFEPVTRLKVWEFSLQYVSVFGAYVAISGLLPNYYATNYPGTDLGLVGLLASVGFIFPASLLRPWGGYLSDRFGAKRVMTMVFALMSLSSAILVFAPGLGIGTFTVALFALGVGMGVGKAAVYKMIPETFPDRVGAVGGAVGLLGALGGVLVPLGAQPLQWATDSPRMLFGVVLALTGISSVWFLLSERPRLRQPQQETDPDATFAIVRSID